MADASDVVFYKSTASSNRGGAITTSKVTNNKNQNFFLSTDVAQALLGSERYRCFYIKNDSLTETLSNVVLYINSNTISEDDEIKIGLEPFPQDNSISLDGVNDFINLGIETSLWNQSNTKFSASIWFYGVDWTGADYRVILGCQNGTDDVFLDVETVANPGKMVFGVTPDAYSTNANSMVDLPPINTWHHYTIVYDSTTSPRCKLYLDAVVGSAVDNDSTGAISQNTEPMVIGAGGDDGGAPTRGYAKDFRYWAGTALSSSDVVKVRNDDPTAPAPSYWLKMDEGVGNPKDNISGTKTGALTNGAAWIKSPAFQVAQTIADIDEEPVGVEWTLAETLNQGLYVAGQLKPGEWRAIWMWRHTTPTEQEAKNRAEFIIAFDPPPGSTGGGSGSGSGTDDEGGTPNPGPSPSDFAFAVTGDWGTSSDTQDTVDNIVSFSDIKLTISTGDLSYADSGDKWASITKKLREDGREMKTAFGNHDRTDGTPQPDLTNFYLSLMNISNDGNAYYDFTYQNFYFIFIDMYSSFTSGSAQYNWIKDKMEKSKNNSAITWRVLVGHEPWYTPKSKHGNNTKARDTYHPLMVANNFDFYMNGHDHDYFRTYPINYNTGSPSSPTTVNTGQEPNYSSPGAMMELQVGTGGRNLYSLGSESWVAKQLDSEFGFLKISVSNSGRQVTGQFYKNNGQVFEKWTIVK